VSALGIAFGRKPACVRVFDSRPSPDVPFLGRAASTDGIFRETAARLLRLTSRWLE